MEKVADQKRITRKPAVRSIFASAAVPMSFFSVASVPVDVLGCRQRGLVAVAIALVGALLALYVTARALIGKARGGAQTAGWIVRVLILSLPAVFVVLTEV